MAKSYVEYTGNGTTTTYAVTFPYLAKLHVHVLIAGEETDAWEWLTPSSIKLDAPTTELITIKRVTPTEPIVDFTDGSVLTENQLDIATIQSLYVAEETQDTVQDKFDTDIEDGGDGVNWNAHGKKIVNVANGTNPQDAVTKSQLDSAAPGLAAEVEKAENAADAAEASKDAAKVSETNAKASEDAARGYNTSAGASEDRAKGHADDAKASADEAADSVKDTYTKDEVDDLIEGASGAIVANYTNKWASSVARDPGVGNLYLVNGMDISSNYSSVTRIYISDTDGDGEVRNFNKVEVDDQIEITSENGSGKYTIVSITDIGGYRELVVNTNKSTGTVANDTPVSIVMNVASAGGTGGIEEAPEDGKQYARQDGDWSEVEASEGGSTTPSVTYTGVYTEVLNIPSTGEVTHTKVPFTGEDWVDGKYTVDTDGSFIINTKFQWSLVNPASNQAFRYCVIFVNDILVYRDAHGVNTEYPYGSLNQTTWVGNLKKGDVVDIRAVQGNVDNVTQTIAIGNVVSIAMLGGSGTGGGSTPTPEALVWEDETTNKSFNTEYTNSNEVPLYVQLYVGAVGKGNYIEVEIDGKTQGYAGNGSGGTVDGLNSLNNPLYIIPAGKKYKVILTGSLVDYKWKEARMPVAVGGGTVTTVDTAIGMVAPFAMDSVPTGWLHCDGSAVSRDTYSLLYSKVGDLYGSGDGSTTFNLPDLQDEFIRGSSDTLPVGNKQDDEFKAHTHLVGGSSAKVPTNANQAKFPGSATIPSSETGGEETRPRNVAMLYCINATAEPSSGGGYTPEKMVWENKKADRELGTVYTNTNDVPLYLYVELTLGGGESKYANLFIDGQNFGANGTGTTTTSFYNSGLILIPSGSTYELRASSADGIVMDNWHEARMPVAVGTGGGSGWKETVLFENEAGAINFALSESYDSFDYLRFDTIRTDAGVKKLNRSDMIPVASCSDLVLDNYSSTHMYYSCEDKINFTCTSNTSVAMFRVVGINTGSGSGSGGDSIWTEDGGIATYDGVVKVRRNGNDINLNPDVGNTGTEALIESTLPLNFIKDITVNGVTVGKGSGTGANNTALGRTALNLNETGENNVAVGYDSLGSVTSGSSNIALGFTSATTLTTGNNNIVIGSGAQPSAPDINNEVTLGNDSITGTRLRGSVFVESNVDTDIRAIAASGKYATLQVDNVEQRYSMQIRPDQNNYFVIRDETSSINLITLGKDTSTGKSNLQIPNCRPGSGAPANMNMDNDGNIFMLTDARSIDEVEVAFDKKLAIKDKLIEKLSARLDELEKKLK